MTKNSTKDINKGTATESPDFDRSDNDEIIERHESNIEIISEMAIDAISSKDETSCFEHKEVQKNYEEIKIIEKDFITYFPVYIKSSYVISSF